ENNNTIQKFKEITKMKNNNFTPKTPTGFDYALWRDDKRVPYVRILSTGEVSVVSEELFRYLRAEEKSYSRYITKNTIQEKDRKGEVISTSSILLSIDFVSDSADDGGVWLIEKTNVEEAVGAKILIEEFKLMLSENQCDVLDKCILQGLSNREYARNKGVSEMAVRKTISKIREKAKIFF
ncbi:MAG: helix-turn-helix transcriptional regulator, partial [Brevinema sp.]